MASFCSLDLRALKSESSYPRRIVCSTDYPVSRKQGQGFEVDGQGKVQGKRG